VKDLLDKLSSYNLFNYLLPGILLALAIDRFALIRVVQKDIAIGIFLYYFLGSIVSRVGSLIVEPFLLKIEFIVYASYSDYLAAAKIDPKLEVLTEQNNMYRTFLGLVFTFAFIYLVQTWAPIMPGPLKSTKAIYFASIFMLYLLSYKKQTAYIRRRVESNIKQ
jgi:hypothetical protein